MPKTTHAHFQGRSLCLERISPLIPSLFGFLGGGETCRLGRPEDNLDFVVGEELFGVVCCMGSGIVALKCSAIQLLMLEIQQQKKYGLSLIHI